MAPRLVALHELVEADAKHPGDELEEGDPLPLARGSKIGRELLGALGGLVSPPVIFVA
jgi:hypothetical protein